MNNISKVKDYYNEITNVDIATVAAELLPSGLGKLANNTYSCDCPNHQSQSKKSLQISVDKQLWKCWGCDVGGDVLHLVEFLQSGTVSTNHSGKSSETHRQARDYLANRIGKPSLKDIGLSKEEIKEAEKQRQHADRIKTALTEAAAYYHKCLKNDPLVLKWVKSKYAISDETINNLQIGYSDSKSKPISHLLKKKGISKSDLIATGAFKSTSDDGIFPFFHNRLIFPYWSRGHVVYMSGRETPWTPDSKWEKGKKYKKLQINGRKDQAASGKIINNSTWYNEDCLTSGISYVVVTEGITDCISLISHGINAVSPTSVSIASKDARRIVEKIRNIDKVFICYDNEISDVGIKKALETAQSFNWQKVEAKVIELPLLEHQETARQTLLNRFGLDGDSPNSNIVACAQKLNKGDKIEVDELISRSKIDINDYFLSGKTKKDFSKLISEALTPLDISIRSLSPSSVEPERQESELTPVLSEISAQTPVEQHASLRLVHKKINKLLPLETLKQQLKIIGERRKKAFKKEQLSNKREELKNAPPGSCKAVIKEILVQTELETKKADYEKATHAAFEWFIDNGARFFYTPQDEPFMYFNHEIYWMESLNMGRRRHYRAMIYKQTGFVATTAGGKTFFEIIANLTRAEGEKRHSFSWLHSDVANRIIYFDLNNENHEIVKISAEKIEVLMNGGNSEEITLSSSDKMSPLQYIPDVKIEEADQLLSKLLIDNMTCSSQHAEFIISWLSCFLLLDFAGTKPMTRFEGVAGSGKTTASKLGSALIYGEPQLKKGTDASNYTDGARNPMISLDNIEMMQMKEELRQFLVTSITGINKEKRRSGTDDENIIEKVKCLLNTTGIEPLCGDLSEVLSRSFIINFDTKRQEANDCFLEAEFMAEIKKNRNKIVSAIIKKTSRALKDIKDNNGQKKVMQLINRELPNHDKKRCNDYLSLMYLMRIGRPEDEDLETIEENFVHQIRTINIESQNIAKESNLIAMALAALFDSYRIALKQQKEQYKDETDANTPLARFTEKFQCEFRNKNEMIPIHAGGLLVVLRRVCREYNLTFEYVTPSQLARRIGNDLEIILNAGFDIEKIYSKKTKAYRYVITKV